MTEKRKRIYKQVVCAHCGKTIHPECYPDGITPRINLDDNGFGVCAKCAQDNKKKSYPVNEKEV